MTIVHMLDGNRLVLALNGELDLTTSDALAQALDEMLNHFPQKQVALDLGEVDFIDSSGLGVILGRYRRLNQQGRQLSLVSVKPNVRVILEIAGILSLVPVSFTGVKA
jgi:stage II sporulation protein AA (anti-sigma F factor antagonist)